MEINFLQTKNSEHKRLFAPNLPFRSQELKVNNDRQELWKRGSLFRAYYFKCLFSTDISEEELKKFQEEGKIVVAGHELSGNDLKVNKYHFTWKQKHTSKSIWITHCPCFNLSETQAVTAVKLGWNLPPKLFVFL